MGDGFFTTTGADAPEAQHQLKPVLVLIFLENTREFPEIITSTGAKFWLCFCLSVLVLVFFVSESNSKTFQDGNGNGNFGKINSNYFQDGNWESMEMKG